MPPAAGRQITVAVVIPAYNAGATIVDALDSVRLQSTRPAEVLIVDDGSTDGTRGVVAGYLRLHGLAARWKLLEQTNKGPGAARDAGVRAAGSDFVAFLDADDVWSQRKLADATATLRGRPIDLLGARFGSDAGPAALPDAREVTLRHLLVKNVFLTSTVVVRRAAYLQSSGFRADQRYSEDFRLWLELAARGFECAVLPVAHATYAPRSRHSVDRLSRRHWQMEKGELSNYFWVYRRGWIGPGSLAFSVVWSITKYARRLLTRTA